MIECTFIHVGGPPEAGKTAFVEVLLAAIDEPVAVARCTASATAQ